VKQVLFIISIFIYTIPLNAQNKVIASVTQLVNNKGVCRACLFSTAVSFQKMEAVQCLSVHIVNQKALFTFNDIPKGKYALFVFHDVNENNKLDKNWLGIPREGYGASRNKLPFAAAPGFEPNSFILNNKDSLFLPVRLRNL
jgi:uncharacterized protein (DUF2141 family)